MSELNETISVELFEPSKHYDTVSKWWTEQKWPTLPLSHLPTTGIVVSYKDKAAAAAWIYKTDSAFCWIEWIVADPEIRHEARNSVLSVLLSSAKMSARLMGFKTIHMSIRNQSLAKRIETQGFTAADTGMTNYVCSLEGGF
jgi:hypothetical protein